MFGLLSRMTPKRWLHILAGGFLLLPYSSAYSQSPEQSYDEYFKGSAIRYLYGYLPDDDWRYLKAQAMQESGLNPFAVSHRGASGLLQIMPDTAPETGLDWADRFDAEKNIKAGAWYMRKRIRAWWPRPTRIDRVRLAWGAYNWGFGNMIDAQARCGNAMLWEDMLPCITPRETREYVPRIEGHYYRLTE